MCNDLPLKNKTILITRPEGLADSLINQIDNAGGHAQHYPVIHIANIKKSDSLNTITANLDNYDMAIFISPTAVQKSLKLISVLPKKLRLAVIGRSTKSALEKQGYHAQIVPNDYNSESLLSSPDLQQDRVTNKSIIIFRGVGGRNLLGDTLIQRGAKVIYAETYQREKNLLPSLSDENLAQLDALAVSSNEGLQYLYELTTDKATLTRITIIVPGTRAQQLAQKLGFSHIIQASNATDDACMHSLAQHFSDSSDD